MNLTGKLLIAPPNVRGNFWSKTVIFVTENHARGSMGLVLNKKSKMSIREFSRQCDVECDLEGYVYIGGPVNSKALTLIHSPEWTCGNTMHINNEFSISSSHDLLHRLAMGDCPNYWRLALGLCAWAPEQLENELKGAAPFNHDFSWLLATPNHTNVFALDGQDQWTQSIEQSGSEFVQNLLA
jgi:putative transcriptional regulator